MAEKINASRYFHVNYSELFAQHLGEVSKNYREKWLSGFAMGSLCYSERWLPIKNAMTIWWIVKNKLKTSLLLVYK